jgi:hypothetical protein
MSCSAFNCIRLKDDVADRQLQDTIAETPLS